MGQKSEPPVPPVVTAMAELDRAVAAHKLLAQRLTSATQDAEWRDDLLRRTDIFDTDSLEESSRKYFDAVGLVQTLSFFEARARREMHQAQNALALVRRKSSRARAEELRIELEIDAASIWDLVGRFENELRIRLDAHGQVAGEIEFFLNAAGERARASTPWTPVLGATGEALWNGIARGAAELAHRLSAPLVAKAALTLPPAPDRALPEREASIPTALSPDAGKPREEESPRQRMARILGAVRRGGR